MSLSKVISMPPIIAKAWDVRQIRFILIGGVNTLSGYCVTSATYFLLMHHVGLYAVIAVSSAINFTISYLNHKRFTFKTSGNYLSESLRFYCVAGVSTAIAFVLLPILIKDFKLNAYLAIALVMVVNVVVGYSGHSRISFRTPTRAE